MNILIPVQGGAGNRPHLLVICRNASLSVQQFVEQMIQTVSKTCQTTVIRECLESVLERSVVVDGYKRERIGVCYGRGS